MHSSHAEKCVLTFANLWYWSSSCVVLGNWSSTGVVLVLQCWSSIGVVLG